MFGCAGSSWLWGNSLAAICRLLLVMPSRVVEHGLQDTPASQLWVPGSRTQAQ